MFLSIWKYIKMDNYIDNIYFMYLYVSIYHFKFVCVCVYTVPAAISLRLYNCQKMNGQIYVLLC